jgi:hypothetical protein
MRLPILLPFIVMAVAAVVWLDARSSARQWQLRLESLREQRRELLALEAERARLHASISAVNAEVLEDEPPLETSEIAQVIAAPVPFTVGEWMPQAEWSNRGQSTPRAAVETALWAAAGGDGLAMQALLEMDAGAQSKAEKLLSQLSPTARSTYVTPEALIANVTMRNIPVTEAQIVWYHESDRDHAAVGVMFATPAHSPEPVVKLAAGKQDNSPPSLSDNRTTKMALLALHRSDSGWRLVVPVSAVDRIAAEIGVSQK